MRLTRFLLIGISILNVKERRSDAGIGCDGNIQPKGTCFADGFHLVVNDGVSLAR